MKFTPLEQKFFHDVGSTPNGRQLPRFNWSRQIPEDEDERILQMWAVTYCLWRDCGYQKGNQGPWDFEIPIRFVPDTKEVVISLSFPKIPRWDIQGRYQGVVRIKYKIYYIGDDDPSSNSNEKDIIEEYPIYFSIIRTNKTAAPRVLWEFPATPYNSQDQHSSYHVIYLPHLRLPVSNPYYMTVQPAERDGYEQDSSQEDSEADQDITTQEWLAQMDPEEREGWMHQLEMDD